MHCSLNYLRETLGAVVHGSMSLSDGISYFKHSLRTRTGNILTLMYLEEVGWFLVHNKRRYLYLKGHEKTVIEHIKPLFRNCDAFIDVGAYVGYYTLFAAHRCRMVVAFEPDPRNFLILTANLKMNGLDNVYICNAAASSEIGYAKLRLGKSSAESSLTSYLKDYAGTIDVKTMTIDDVVASLGLERVNILKVDVEGYGLNVFKGAEKTLEEFRPIIVFEVHRSCNEKEIKALKFLIDTYDYNFRLIEFRSKRNFIVILT